MVEFALILPAAGSSSRFGGGRNKLYENIDGGPVIGRAIEKFVAHPHCRQLVIATSDVAVIESMFRHEFAARSRELGTRVKICQGGVNRAESVKRALDQVDPSVEWVAVHDAARPLVSTELIDRTLQLAVEHGAAVPALPVHLTIKQATGPLPAKVERTVPRQQLWAMQTPQIVRRADLLDAYARCPLPLDQVTDDVQLLELTGREVWLAPGDDRNIKITTSTDLLLAEMLFKMGSTQ